MADYARIRRLLRNENIVLVLAGLGFALFLALLRLDVPDVVFTDILPAGVLVAVVSALLIEVVRRRRRGEAVVPGMLAFVRTRPLAAALNALTTALIVAWCVVPWILHADPREEVRVQNGLGFAVILLGVLRAFGERNGERRS